MKRIATAIFVSLLSLPAILRADMTSDIAAVLKDKLLANAIVGIEVVALGETPGRSKVIYRNKSETPLIPASNLKLITTAAALSKLGADFQFETKLVKHGEDLIVIGDGDPTLGDVELVRKYGWTTTTVFDSWATGLKQMGVLPIANVRIDDSVFDLQFVHPSWPADQLNLRYVAGVAGLNLNANCIDFYLSATTRGQPVSYVLDPPTQYATIRNSCITSDINAVSLSMEQGTRTINLKGSSPGSRAPISVTVDDPSMMAGTVLAESLKKQGVSVTGTVQRDRTARSIIAALGNEVASQDYVQLAHHTTPIGVALARANKDSMNVYAESLCKRLGFASTGESGSWSNGPGAMAAFVASLNVPRDQFTFDDGCGLSKKNGMSAHAISTVLQHMYFGDNRQVYIDSLSVAGVDGTLDDRFKGSDLRARVFGKSGFVNGVSTLSGYFRAKDDRWYVFSILMNGIPRLSNSAIKPLQEKIVKAVDAEISK